MTQNTTITTTSSPPPPPSTTKKPTSFFRRTLPPKCISFSSTLGKSLFQRSLLSQYCHAFFPLIEQFHTQNEPAYCGLGTLTMILNALSLDPGRIWKGPWRFFSEELLDCCVPLDRVKKMGITMREFACIARCNGARVQVWRDGQRLIRRDKGEQQPKEDASPKDESSKQTVSSSNEDVLTSIEHFRMHIRNSCAVSCQRTPGCESGFIAVSYDRSVLGQTGSGHFSPIGAYHEGDPEKNEPDRVLILDCARFKYPPHWCTVQDLYDAMNTIDPDTGAKRGWAIISRAPSFELQTSLSVKLSPHYSITELSQHFENLLNDASKLIQHETDIDLVLKQLLDLLHKHLDGFVHLSAEGCTLCGDKGCKCISQETSEKNGEPTKANNQSALRDTTPDCCPNKGDIDDEEYLTFSLKTLIYEAKGTKLFQKLKLLDEKCEMKDLILHTVILLAIPFKTYGLLNQVSGEMKELCNIQGTTNFLEREVATLKSQVLTLLNYDSPECDGGSDRCKGKGGCTK